MSTELRNEQVSSGIYFITQNPRGWVRAFVDQNKKNLGSSKADLIALQEERWQQRTRVKVADSHFSIIVPIHNEQKSLPSFIGSLMLSDVPWSCPVSILFITNDCSDESPRIVDSFLRSVGKKVGYETLPLDDPGLRQPAVITHLKNLTLMHIDTATRGKANALRIGNQLAVSAGHRIAVSVDANNFMEPNALALLYGGAFRDICSDEDGVVVLSAYARGIRRPSRQNSLLNLGKDAPQELSGGSICVNGWMMAWDTNWLKSIDGPPQVAVEDYALSVMARKGNFRIKKIPEAVIWGHIPNNLADSMSSRIRYIRGRNQLMKTEPSTEEIIRRDYYFMRKTFKERISVFFQEIRSSQQTSLIRGISNFFFWEYALRMGNKQYRTNPLNQSWEPILSTK